MTEPLDLRKRSPRPTLISALTLIAVLLVYSASLLVIPSKGFWGADNGTKFIQLQAILASKYKSIDIDWPGKSIDPGYMYNPLPDPWAVVVDNKLYGTFSTPFALLSSFPYRALREPGLLCWPLLGGFGTIFGVWLLVGLLVTETPARRLAQAFGAGLAALSTPVWFYSLAFWEHTPATALAVLAVVFYVHHYLRDHRIALLAAAALMALACYFRDDLYLAGLVLAVGLLTRGHRRPLDILLFALTFFFCLVPLWLLHWVSIGNPLGTHAQTVSVLDDGFFHYLRSRLSAVRWLLISVHSNRWLSALISVPYLFLWIASVVPALRRRFSLEKRTWLLPALAAFACAAGAITMYGYMTADSLFWLMNANSLFSASPVLIFSLIGASYSVKKPKPQQTIVARTHNALLLGVLAYAAVYVLSTPFNLAGGVHWGCRYLLAAYAIFCALAATNLAKWWTEPRKKRVVGVVLVGVVIGISVWMQVHSLSLLKQRREFSIALNDYVASRPEEVILTDGPFIPQQLASVFYQKAIFRVRSPSDAIKLRTMLRDAGISEVLIIRSVGFTGRPMRGHQISDGDLNLDKVTITSARIGVSSDQ